MKTKSNSNSYDVIIQRDDVTILTWAIGHFVTKYISNLSRLHRIIIEKNYAIFARQFKKLKMMLQK